MIQKNTTSLALFGKQVGISAVVQLSFSFTLLLFVVVPLTSIAWPILVVLDLTTEGVHEAILVTERNRSICEFKMGK